MNMRGLYYDEETNTLWLIDTAYTFDAGWETAAALINEDELDIYIDNKHPELKPGHIDCERVFCIIEEAEVVAPASVVGPWEPFKWHKNATQAVHYHEEICNFYNPET